MNANLDELLHRWREGNLSDDELRQLNDSLSTKEGRTALRKDWFLDSALPEALRTSPVRWLTQEVEQIASAQSKFRSLRFLWRPLTMAAAAGVIFGMFCTSMVWAYAVPRTKMETQRFAPIFTESFEDVKMITGRGFPNDAGGWSGDFAAVVSTEANISPEEGQHMARLAPVAGRKFCAATRIVDLTEFPQSSDTESRTVEVTASFHGTGSQWLDRNQIRLAAFSEVPQDVKAIWNGDNLLEQVLQHLGRTVTVKPGEHGWQTLKVSMEIPASARSLVIHLGAGLADDAGPKTLHYIDDVHAQFVITATTP